MVAPASDVGELIALLQEARNSDEQVISAILSNAGFDDIPAIGLIVLGAIAIGGEKADDLMLELGIPGQEADQTIGILARHGYLERRSAPGDGRPTQSDVTRRGRTAAVTGMNAIRRSRWADLPLRPGDIVICSPRKSGTTWLQTICALLIFQTPDLPAALVELSPWLDDVNVPRDELFSRLGAQQHRRFVKTHLPLNQAVIDPQVSYLVIARHPLDAAVSLYHQHKLEITPSRSGRTVANAPIDSAREWLLRWFEPSQPATMPLPATMRLLSDAWARRGAANVMLLHYQDLCDDLDGEMHRISAFLGITVSDETWPDLVKAATIEQMRAAADRLQPLPGLKDSAAFFRKGGSGAGRDLLTSTELARYYEYTTQLAPPDLLAWLHREDGRAAG